MKLNKGDKIRVTSDALANTEAGIYWVEYISYCHGHPYYGLRKLYSRIVNHRFFTNAIDSLIGSGIKMVEA